MKIPEINTDADSRNVHKRLGEAKYKSWSEYAGSPEGLAEYEAWENVPQEVKEKLIDGELE